MVLKIAIIGGGIAGSTIAMKLSEIGIKSILFEKTSKLVSGPPMCHLHAGGSLYPQIPIQQCKKLLKQSINTLKYFKFCSNIRPTLLTIPQRDPKNPQQIINKLQILTKQYQNLIKQNPTNQVLGQPSKYFQIFTKQQVYKLRQKQIPSNPNSIQQWLIPPAKYLNLEKFKFPFVMVQQYGLSSMRISAFSNLALTKNKNCKIFTNTTVIGIQQKKDKWNIRYNSKGCQGNIQADFLVNACGYETGIIDNMLGFKKQRFLQFKSAYISHWNQCHGLWPQIIIHGKRKTPQGMAQLTPYKNKFFQIHAMTEQITLFQNGLVQENNNKNNQFFGNELHTIIKNGWQEENALKRTRNAIDFVSYFIPSFGSARETSQPLWGIQQIPGRDPNLRASEISFQGQRYARAQIVKASTAIEVASSLIDHLKIKFGIQPREEGENFSWITKQNVESTAEILAVSRKYPAELAQIYE